MGQWEEMPIFGLQVPSTGIKDVPLETLQPSKAWQMNGQSEGKFQETAIGLANLFQGNFQEYADLCSPEVVAAGPKAWAARAARRASTAARFTLRIPSRVAEHISAFNCFS